MNCTDPPALTDLELAMYVDGEATAATIAHLAHCPSCRERAAALAQQQVDQQTLLFRSTCPTPAELRDYQLGLLARADQSTIALHLARCPHCTHELFVLETFLLPQTEPDTAPWYTPITLLVAELIQQVQALGTGAQLAGQRGATAPLQLFQSGEVQVGITIEEEPTSGTYTINGLIANGQALLTDNMMDNEMDSGAQSQQLLAHLWRDNMLIATTMVDSLLGDFRFANISPAAPDVAYEVIISAEQTKLRLPNLHVQSLENH